MGGKCRPLYCVCGCTLPQRVVVAILCVFGVIVAYGQRSSLNIAITRIVSVAVRNTSQECLPENSSALHNNIRGGSYHWSHAVQGWLLQAFFVGYFLGQIPCGMAADELSGKWSYIVGIGISTILTVVTPILIQQTPWYIVYIVRILLGIAQSVAYPSMSALIAHWVPASERATLGAFCFASNSLGAVLGNLLSGIIITYTRYWPNAFYFWTGLGIFWCCLFILYIYDHPQTHHHITEKEKLYLEKAMPHSHKLKVPWKGLLMDKGVWALIIGQMGHDFTLFLMMTNMPKYFSDVLHMTVRDLSLVTSIPFAGIWLLSIITGEIIDHGIKNRNWKLKPSRTVVTYLSFVIPNSMLVLMVYMECKILPSALCFALAVIFKGPHFAGFRVNHMDITVNFNGITMSIVNTSGCISGFISPLIVSYVAPHNRLKEWKIVMWIYFSMAFVFTTYYVIMAQTERAAWDVPPDEVDDYNKAKEAKADAKAERKAKKAEEKEAKEAMKVENVTKT